MLIVLKFRTVVACNKSIRQIGQTQTIIASEEARDVPTCQEPVEFGGVATRGQPSKLGKLDSLKKELNLHYKIIKIP